MLNDTIATVVLKGQDIIISFLIDCKLNLNEKDLLDTSLRVVCIICNKFIVRLFLKLDASLHALKSFNKLLQAAIMQDYKTITRTLLSHDANVNDEGKLYKTAL